MQKAEIFADIAVNKGVPKNQVLLEDKSTNTGENIRFSMELISKKHISTDSVVVVTKPYMERRTYATAKKLFPSKNFIVTSPNISYEEYPNSEISKDLMINIMVGDLQRIMEYPAKGFQIEMEVPEEVRDACKFLIGAGFDQHLIR